MFIQDILGVGFLTLGLLSISSYSDALSDFRLNWFHKELKPMQERWGKTAGTIIHILGYVVAPLGFGIIFLTGMVVFH
jgi:hypothetical protein